MKPITGQYECVHHSGIGLDYFTSRIDRLVLYPDGRFTLSVQQMSSVANAAKSWLNKQAATNTPPETRQEGHYTQQQNTITLTFDNGGFEEAHLSPNTDGIQIGPNYFPKVSDSPVLPSAQRLKQDMDDIAKGLKIASTLGNVAIKAAKTFQGAIGTGQSQTEENPPASFPSSSPQPNRPAATPTSPDTKARFCEQCGARMRPDKHFCNSCGAPIN